MKPYEILGIGGPVLDCIIHVDFSFLESIEGEKEGMLPINEETFHNFLHQFGSSLKYTIGGSAANTIKGLARFNHSCAFWGKIGDDFSGIFFKNKMEHLGVCTLFTKSILSKTAHSFCFVTPDGKRTMRTYLGASSEMHSHELNPKIFQNIKLLHIEGYCLLKNDLALKSLEMAKNAGALISMDLSSFEIVQTYKSSFFSLLKEYIDIVFANEQEASALFGLNSKDNCLELNQLVDIAVILCGENGCLIGNHENVQSIKTSPISAKDSTGAGDFFASGFLHGYLEKKPLEMCAEIGNRTAKAVIQVDGTDIPNELWKEI